MRLLCVPVGLPVGPGLEGAAPWNRDRFETRRILDIDHAAVLARHSIYTLVAMQAARVDVNIGFLVLISRHGEATASTL
jgi:hypothetical protein